MKTYKVYYLSSIDGKINYDTFRSHSLENVTKKAKYLYKERLIKIEE